MQRLYYGVQGKCGFISPLSDAGLTVVALNWTFLCSGNGMSNLIYPVALFSVLNKTSLRASFLGLSKYRTIVRESEFPFTSQTDAVEGGLPNGDAYDGHLLSLAESRQVVLPDGSVSQVNTVRPEDWLLQLAGRRLHGTFYSDTFRLFAQPIE